MKKLISIVAAFAVLAGFAFADAPVFDDPKAYIIDTQEIPGKLKDDIKLFNYSFASNFNIKVSAYDDKAGKWIDYGTGFLKETGDTETIRTNDKKAKITKYRYFAVTTDAEGSFRFITKKLSNDLRIWFFDDKDVDNSIGTVIDTKTIKGKFKDNVKLLGAANLKYRYTFDIYGYNEEGQTPELIAVSILQGSNDTDTNSRTFDDGNIAAYRFYKIVNRQGKDLEYKAEFKSNDLIITVAQK